VQIAPQGAARRPALTVEQSSPNDSNRFVITGTTRRREVPLKNVALPYAHLLPWVQSVRDELVVDSFNTSERSNNHRNPTVMDKGWKVRWNGQNDIAKARSERDSRAGYEIPGEQYIAGFVWSLEQTPEPAAKEEAGPNIAAYSRSLLINEVAVGKDETDVRVFKAALDQFELARVPDIVLVAERNEIA
jgi:hypothetical protein